MIVLGALTLICAIAWAYLAYMGWGMAHMDVGATMAVMPQMVSWGPIDVALVFAMWSIMMVAMMLPSAAPTILLFAALRRRAAHSRALPDVTVFVAGYVATWVVFSLLASLMQGGLLEVRLVSPLMVAASPVLGGGLLLAAGVFELTPLRRRASSSAAIRPLSSLRIGAKACAGRLRWAFGTGFTAWVVAGC